MRRPFTSFEWGLIAAIAAVLVVLCARAAFGQGDPCRGWIKRECCCTASCCREISMREIEPFEGGYRVIATGRIAEHVDFSRENEPYLCDCNGGPRAYCLFLPPPST